MTKENLFAAIEKADLIPIPVNREGDAEEILSYYAGDDLSGFLAAAKMIGATVAFVMTHRLEEEQFFYSFDDDEDDETAEEEIDLAPLLPALAKYKKRIGEPYFFFIMAKGGVADLCYVVEADWMSDFENEVERAVALAVVARHNKK